MAGLAVVLIGLVTVPASAAKAPTFSALLTHDGSCGFTLKAGWSNTAVGSVVGQWIVDNAVVTTTFTNTGKSRTVTMTPGPGVLTSGSHTWSIRTQFYSGQGLSGVLVGEVVSNQIVASCDLPIAPQ